MKFWLPSILLCLLAPFTPSLDLSISRFFYDPVEEHFMSNPFLDFIFAYGVFPANMIVGIAIIGLFGSFVHSSWKKWRVHSLFLILILALGSGVVVHGLLKEYWGRPRPKQVIEFGGKQEFRPFYYPNFFHQPEPSKSFACGHCSMGFYFFALTLLGRRLQSKKIFWLGVVLTTVLGTLLTFTRIAQGGHFFSDTVVTAVIMWWVSLGCEWLLYAQTTSRVGFWQRESS